MSLHSRPQIPALTGLRFFAAFFILWQHSIRWIAQFQNADVYSSFGFLGVPGMSLFFVLSSFVIHYNYRDLFLRHGTARVVRICGGPFCSIVSAISSVSFNRGCSQYARCRRQIRAVYGGPAIKSEIIGG
jgi:peptidoglycan/LPS O-acetylase OafA/YrhL